MTPLERSLFAGTFAAAAFWGALVAADLRVELGEAKLPGFSAAQQAVDARLGEKLIDRARQEAEERYVREKAAYDRSLGGVVAEAQQVEEGVTGVLTRSQDLADTYRKEFVAASRAKMSAEYLQRGYKDMLDAHSDQLLAVTGIQEKVNEYQQKINQYNQIYIKVKFLMGR